MKVETITVGNVTIEPMDVRALTDADLEEINAYGNLMAKESRPEDPPTPLEMTRAYLRNIPEFIVIHAFAARNEAGELIGRSEATFQKTDDNKHLLNVHIGIRADYRQRGIAKVMLRLLADVADAEGRTLLMGGTSERIPAGAEFAKLIGAEAGLAQHMNKLLMSDLDLDLVRRWVAEGPARAPGYSLLAVDGPYPDEMLESVVAVHNLMNTAPRDDLDMEDFVVTVDQVREWDKTMQESGEVRWSLFAKEEATGALVGFTEVFWNPLMPTIVGQGATAVDPTHRGHALGKWMKAAMLDRIARERPEATEVRTGNADSNDAMLGINKQLGFKHHIATTVWQVPVEKVRAYLGSSV